MSRIATQPQTRTPVAATPVHIPQEKIAQRAYEKWMKRGCKHGAHMQDWSEAEAEIKAEITSSAKPGATPSRR
jgi:Protein of unknown function (DUF2934)